MKINLQLFGGRGSSSGVSKGGSARERYEQAVRERERLANIRPSERTPEQHQQIDAAMRRETEAAYGVISEMSDSQIQRAADNYIRHRVENPAESNANMRRWIHSISSTKRDGSPTANTMANARETTWSVINSGHGMGLNTYKGRGDNYPRQTDRIANAIVQAASRYRNRFD